MLPIAGSLCWFSYCFSVAAADALPTTTIAVADAAVSKT